MRGMSIASFVLAVFFILTGLHRLFKYDYSESLAGNNINVWVDSDAYNYIINGTHAISFMMLTLIFVIIGFAIELFIRLNDHKSSLSKDTDVSLKE